MKNWTISKASGQVPALSPVPPARRPHRLHRLRGGESQVPLTRTLKGQLNRILKGQLPRILKGKLSRIVKGQLTRIKKGQLPRILKGKLTRILNGQQDEIFCLVYFPWLNSLSGADFEVENIFLNNFLRIRKLIQFWRMCLVKKKKHCPMKHFCVFY